VWVTLQGEVVEQFATALETQGLVDVVVTGEIGKKTGQEVGLLKNEFAGDVLPSGGIVICIEQAREPTGFLQLGAADVGCLQYFVGGKGGIVYAQLVCIATHGCAWKEFQGFELYLSGLVFG
jgi:hypothetical protein